MVVIGLVTVVMVVVVVVDIVVEVDIAVVGTVAVGMEEVVTAQEDPDPDPALDLRTTETVIEVVPLTGISIDPPLGTFQYDLR